MAGVTLKKWVNFLTEEQPEAIDPKGSEWVGAWWLGYALVIAALLIFSTPLFFFPSEALKKANFLAMINLTLQFLAILSPSRFQSKRNSQK